MHSIDTNSVTFSYSYFTALFLHFLDKPELAYHPAAPNFGNQQNQLDNPTIPMDMPYLAAFALPRLHTSSPHQHVQGRNSTSSYDSSNPNSRRGSVDFSGSDSTSVSGHASGSLPCSANCSNVHLPLGNSGVDSLGYEDVSALLRIFVLPFSCICETLVLSFLFVSCTPLSPLLV